MKPTVGRIVHYQVHGGPQAAIVTAVHDAAGAVSLCVIRPDGTTYTRAGYSPEPKLGHWNWPPKEP